MWREVVVRVGSAENADAEEEAGVIDGVGDEAHHQQADVLQCPRHWQLPDISTALPPASARSARAPAMFPRPIMLIPLIAEPAFRKWMGRQAHPVVVDGYVVDAVE